MIKERVINVLDDWKICDSLLSEYGCTSDKVFIHLIRPSFIHSTELYKSHVKELIERFMSGKDLTLATNSEILCFMGFVNETVSLPGNEALIAMRTLFSDLVSESDVKQDILKELHTGIGNFEEPKAKVLIETLKIKLKNKTRI